MLRTRIDRPSCRGGLLVRRCLQTHHQPKGCVDRTEFIEAQAPYQLAESAQVHRTRLFDEDPCRVPSISMPGRNVAGRAEVDVGATSQAERTSRSSDCTTIA